MGNYVQKHSECTVSVPAFCNLLELGWDGVAWVIDLVEVENLKAVSILPSDAHVSELLCMEKTIFVRTCITCG